jgi:hypothetical protein
MVGASKRGRELRDFILDECTTPESSVQFSSVHLLREAESSTAEEAEEVLEGVVFVLVNAE